MVKDESVESHETRIFEFKTLEDTSKPIMKAQPHNNILEHFEEADHQTIMDII